MITGAHSIIYTTNSEADMDFFKNILKIPNVDAGGGWLIFGLPASEVALHPSTENGLHEFYLICDNINLFVKEMQQHKIVCSEIEDLRWGNLVRIVLPGGGKLGVYEPKHVRPSAT
ncbi:MAG: extradiol dioxygenase [Ferruginibacter sp.]